MGIVDPTEYTLSSKENIILRSALPDDAPAIIELITSVFNESDYHISIRGDFKRSEEKQRERIQKFSDEPGKLMLVALYNNEIVAIQELENNYRKRLQHQCVVWSSISPKMRNKGLGRIMAQYSWQWVQNNSLIERVYIQILANNERSLALCRKMGFVEEARLKEYVKLSVDCYVDLIIFSRDARI